MSVLNVFGMSIFQSSSARCLYLALLPKSYSSIYEAIALCGTRCVIIDIQAQSFTRVNSLLLQSQCLAITAFCKAPQKDKFHLSFKRDRATVSFYLMYKRDIFAVSGSLHFFLRNETKRGTIDAVSQSAFILRTVVEYVSEVGLP